MKNPASITGAYLSGKIKIPVPTERKEPKGWLKVIGAEENNLKKINDVYGHKAGDHALRLVGATLTECMKNAVVCRLGGDEFLFYLPEVSEAEINMRVRKLFDSFEAAKNATTETSPAFLSCGLCMCRQGESFECASSSAVRTVCAGGIRKSRIGYAEE